MTTRIHHKYCSIDDDDSKKYCVYISGINYMNCKDECDWTIDKNRPY